MLSLKRIAAGAVLLGFASIAMAQSSSTDTSTSNQGSSDALTQARKEKAEARKEYKAGKITKQQYKQARRDANAKAKAAGAGPVNAATGDLPPNERPQGSGYSSNVPGNSGGPGK
jgi:hypothetical protein